MWGVLGGWLLNLASGPILDGYKARLAADTSANKVGDLIVKQIDAEMAARAGAREIRLATAGFWEMRLLTFLIAFPFVEHLLAVWASTRWGWYSRGGWFEHCWFEAGVSKCGVPAFPVPFSEWEGAILLSFFGAAAVGKSAQAIAAGLIARGRK